MNRVRIKTTTGIRIYDVSDKTLEDRYIKRGDVYHRAYKVEDASGRVRKRIADKDKIIMLPGKKAYVRYEPERQVEVGGETYTQEQIRHLFRKERGRFVKWRMTAPVEHKTFKAGTRFQVMIKAVAYVGRKHENITAYSTIRTHGSPERALLEAKEKAMDQARGWTGNVKGTGGSDTEPDRMVWKGASYIRWV